MSLNLLKENTLENPITIKCVFYKLNKLKLAIFIILCILTCGIALLISRVEN